MAYVFDENKYKTTFDGAFGVGAFDRGMEEAALLGRTSAEVKFAEQLYKERLKAAEEEAARRRAASYSRSSSRSSSSKKSTGSTSSSKSSNSLVNQFRSEKAASQLSPLELYNQQQKKKMGVSVAKNVSVVPIAKNKSLSPYEQMKLVQSDAAWVKKNR